jgi:hypothetical protein
MCLTETPFDASKGVVLEMKAEKAENWLYLYLVTRMEGKIIRIVLNPLKMWQSSNIWEQL